MYPYEDDDTILNGQLLREVEEADDVGDKPSRHLLNNYRGRLQIISKYIYVVICRFDNINVYIVFQSRLVFIQTRHFSLNPFTIIELFFFIMVISRKNSHFYKYRYSQEKMQSELY